MVQSLVRLVFLILCVLPTTGVTYLATVGWERSSNWQATLEGSLERPVRLGAVRTPTPRMVVLRDVTIGPSSRHPGQAFLPTVTIERTEHAIALVAPAAHLSGCSIEALASLAERLVLTEPLPSQGRSWQRVEAHIAAVTIVPPRLSGRADGPQAGEGTAASFTLAEMTISCQRMQDSSVPSVPADRALDGQRGPGFVPEPPSDIAPIGSRLTARVRISFHLPGATEPRRSELELARYAQPGGARTTWTLTTGEGRLPAQVVQFVCPMALPGLEDAAFRGRIGGVLDRAEEIDLAGTWSGVDLAGLVTDRFPHKMSGTAEVSFRTLQLCQGRVVSAVGELRSDGGVIGPSLLEAAATHLGVTVTRPVTRNWPYQELAIGFQLTGQSLELAGLLRGPGLADEPALVRDAGGPLVVEGSARRVEPLALVRMLVPEIGYAVPATEQTRSLLLAFPTPSVRPVVTAEQPRGTIRLR